MLKKAIIILYAIVIVVMAMATFFSPQTAAESIYGAWWFSLLWAILTALAVAYIVKRRMRRPSLVLLHGSFVVILAGALLTHLTGKQTGLHLRQGVPTAHLEDGSQLPFSVELKAFRVSCYNGTDAAMDFASDLIIKDAAAAPVECTISMNKIYSRDGVRLYQSAYDPDMKGSYIAVNMDPYGIPVTYLGYALLFISLIWMLIDPKLMFRKSLRSLTPLTPSSEGKGAVKCVSRLKGFVVILILHFSFFTLHAQAATVLPESKADEFGRLMINYNDRICPLQTYALDFTKKITGSRSWDGNTAEQVLTGFLFYPDQWNKEKCIEVKNSGVRERFGLDKYVSLNDFFTPMTREYVLGLTLQESYQGNNDKLHQEVQKLDEKIMLIMSLEHGQTMRIFPFKGKWYTPVSKFPRNIEKDRAIYFQHSIPMLIDFSSASDWSNFDEMVQKMRKYQYTYGYDAIPSDTQITCERINNAVPFATILFIVCLTFGFISVVPVSSRFKKFQKVSCGVVLILSWLTLTFSLALRWIISGTVPMANGYESMLFMAWIILLAALLTMWRLPIIATFGLIISGFCLLVSHLSQMDPQITHIMPVLSSPLLTIHVSIIMMAYALLSLTCICGVWALCQKGRAEYLQKLSSLFLYPAMACLGPGIFIGAIWANVSWGTYWSWDPKETWALVTFMVYAAPLHGVSLPIFRKPLAYHIYIVLAFLSVLFTYFGVNYVLGGMHSYA